MAHFAAFVVLACRVKLARWPWSLRCQILVLTAYAVGTELGQYLAPGRMADFFDGLANLLGIVAGIVIGVVIEKLSNDK
jgi:VanZ family protein